MGWREQCKKTTNNNPPNTQASPHPPRNYFSVDLANTDPREAIAALMPKNLTKNICHTPSSSLEIACACGWKFSLHSPAVNLLSHPSSLPSLFPPFQSSCLKPHPQLHKQHEGAYRSRNWTCLLTSAPAEVCARNGYECQSSWYGHSPVPFISTVVLSHIAPLPI